ncbi:MAG: hypothetical protein M1818_006604 [Claussenomyces sp. TS43310]|nr:MAG: hypothetical protein M1818_006961 [Claussenomyces sp. TS43310]KAI9735027.1 MAG: hypothetical protein M1818_006604 [Claussenomyces sp. TS43310]
MLQSLKATLRRKKISRSIASHSPRSSCTFDESRPVNPSPATGPPELPCKDATTAPSNFPPEYTPVALLGQTFTLESAGLLSRSDPPAPSAGLLTSPEKEDPYIFLSTFNTLIVIDDSGSMTGRSWRETEQALSQLLPTILAHDQDGIDIFFLNHVSQDPGDPKQGVAAGGYRNVVSVQTVERIFRRVRPAGGTPTGSMCRKILKPYLANLEAEAKMGRIDNVKPLNIIVITDGVPSDDVESILLAAAKKLDALDAAPHQVGVQFFQVGNERGAAEALKELDDGLVDLVQGDVRDIVDTCTWMGGNGGDGSEGTEGSRELSASGILKVVLGAVVKKLDRKRCSEELKRA